MNDPRRIQLDLKDLPQGVVPALHLKALEETKNGRLSQLCRDLLIREAGFATESCE